MKGYLVACSLILGVCAGLTVVYYVLEQYLPGIIVEWHQD